MADISPPHSKVVMRCKYTAKIEKSKGKGNKNKVHSKNRRVHLIIYIKERNQNQSPIQK